jgi:integrase/recombinase XerD
MDDSIPTVTTTDTETAIPPVLDADNLIKVFTQFLSFDVADGAASAETIIAYWSQVKAYLNWCQTNSVDPAAANRETIKVYRHYLVGYKYGRNTIALKLAAVRRFYDAAIEYGLLIYNPAHGIKPPRSSTHPAETITYLEQDEANRLLQGIDHSNELKLVRDRLLLGLMTIEGTRTVELYRCNLADIKRLGKDVGLRLDGKRRVRTIPLTPELAQLLDVYLTLRRAAGFDSTLTDPLFINFSHQAPGERLSRRGMRYLVDHYLNAADLKVQPGRKISAHSLRHTAGTLAVQNGVGLRQVQDLLGHADLRTTALYTHVGDKWKNNPGLKSGVSVFKPKDEDEEEKGAKAKGVKGKGKGAKAKGEGVKGKGKRKRLSKGEATESADVPLG